MSTSALCQACALCCDGTLFGRVPLRQGESVPLPVVTTETGAQFLAQPCAGLEGTRCRCYADRPTACRGFECLLVVALRDGETSLAEALEIVERAKAPELVDRAGFLRFHFGRR